MPCALSDRVPLITPVAAFKKSPAGNAPEMSDQLMGAIPPVAANAVEYDWPTIPPGKDIAVMVNAGTIVSE